MLTFSLLALSLLAPAEARSPKARGTVEVDCPGEPLRTLSHTAALAEVSLQPGLSCRLTLLSANPAPPPAAVATVNGRPVTTQAFEQAAARKTWPEGDRSATAQELLDGLVADELLYQEARAVALDLDPKVQKVMVNTLLRNEVYGLVRNSQFTDRELEAYYQAHLADFVIPLKRQLKIITLSDRSDRDHDATLAALVRLRAELTPDNFKDKALEHSEDPYRRRGGDWGFITQEGKPGLAQAAVDVAFTTPLHTISEPVDIGTGWMLVFPSSERERVERTYQQMKGSVLRKVKNERLKELYEEYVAGLRQGATIEVDQARVDQLSAEARGQPAYDFNGALPSLSIGTDDDDDYDDEDDTDDE